MSYTAQLYIPFSTNALTDLVSAVTPSKTNTATVVDGVFDSAWQMDTITKATYTGITSLFASVGTIGFWLKPVNPGMVTNPSTGATESLKMPLFSMCNFNTSVDPVTASNVQFIVWEETQSDGTNVMKVQAGSGGAIYTSNTYTTGVYHYFVIRISTSSITMRIDFVSDSGLLSGTPTTLPTGGVFAMNSALVGKHYQIGRNQGTIDDLVVFNTNKTDSEMQRAGCMGAQYLADSALANTAEVDQAFVFDDASTVQINSVYSSRGNLYVARSDGKLLKGTKTLWESRRLFGTDKEVEGLRFYTIKGSTSLQVSSDGLEIRNEIVKL